MAYSYYIVMHAMLYCQSFVVVLYIVWHTMHAEVTSLLHFY